MSQFPTTSEEYEIRRTLSYSQSELEKITNKKNELVKTINRCKQIIAPWKKLNDKCLLHIFVCLSEDHGPLVFPLRKQRGFPPQLVISHVCSRWRVVSLSAQRIWANVKLHKYFHYTPTVYLRLLMRAGRYPVSLAIDLECVSPSKTFEVLSRIMQVVRIRTLNIKLDFNQFEAMNRRPEPIHWHSSFEDVKLGFIFIVNNINDNDIHLGRHHYLLERASSIAFRGRGITVGTVGTGYLPWTQLSYLNIQNCRDMTLQEATKILQQMPIVEVLYLAFNKFPVDLDREVKVTLSCLRKLKLRLDSATTKTTIVNDDFLRAFECPKLVEFNLYTYHGWSLKTYSLLKGQYNLKNLEQLDLASMASVSHYFLSCCLPMSIILRDAPMLQRLGLAQGVILDDDAMIGIATGTLGRYLSYIWFRSKHHFEEAIDMILSRQKNARRLISESRNWKEEISLFREIYVSSWESQDYQGPKALEEAGIKFEFISSDKLNKKHPFLPYSIHTGFKGL